MAKIQAQQSNLFWWTFLWRNEQKIFVFNNVDFLTIFSPVSTNIVKLFLMCIWFFAASICGVALSFSIYESGEDAALSCSVFHSDPRFRVKWRYWADTLMENGSLLEASSWAGRLSVNHEGSLIMKRVRASDAGSYQCYFNTINVLENVLLVLSSKYSTT